MVEWRSLEWLQNPNLKEMTKESFQRLKNSLKKNNFIMPFNVWQNNGKTWILDGHHRKRALEEIEKEGVEIPQELPANFIECKDRKEAVKLILVYSSIYANVTEEGLYEMMSLEGLELEEIKLDIDLPQIDFDHFEAGYFEKKGNIDDDEVPEVTQAVTKTGDLWLLGPHRVLCGDSTKREDVERLMAGRKADMVFTDPPYGINIVSTKGAGGKLGFIGTGGKLGFIGASGWVPARPYKPVQGDDRPFDPTWLLTIGENQIIFGGNYFANLLPNHACWLIWDKREGIPSNNFADCEMAWTSFDSPARIYRHLWSGLLRKGNRDIDGISKYHPTQKPVDLFAAILIDFSKKTGIIIDPYIGSGTTLIACEKTKRICYGMEIDPHYCDVIVERWVKYTGKDAVREDGAKWSELKRETL
jgi:DNA modification methylase